jgi:hypothetical protein
MAFRKHAVDHAVEIAAEGAQQRSRHVLALRNGYHGDTLGAMACSEESVFNAGQTPWYRAHGLFLDAPTCGMTKGVWEVRRLLALTLHARDSAFDMACGSASGRLLCLLDECKADSGTDLLHSMCVACRAALHSCASCHVVVPLVRCSTCAIQS